MKVRITIEVTEELEEEAVLEQIEALLEACHANFTWEDSGNSPDGSPIFEGL